MRILDRINSHNDLLQLNDPERTKLCQEIREFLIDNVSKTGGHLAGNLGIVELSVAIETVYNTMEDRLVFDVGHQSYVHKLLTGRRADFSGLRQFGGLSGFPKPSESDADAFVAGHASSSVSIALGMARARTLLKKNYDVVAVIGDGACTGGMAYEGLNDAAVSGEPMVVILNDNEMSISKNVGGISRYLSHLRSSDNYLDAKKAYRQMLKKLPGGTQIYHSTSKLKNRVKQFLLKTSIFENMGFTYLGPADGHDLPGLISLLTAAKELREPVLVHVVTKKGSGYSYAEKDPAKFHGIGKFDPQTGNVLAPKVKTFSDVFGETIVDLAEKNNTVCAITAAMPAGTGLTKFQSRFPKRLFDVGIAEEHAISMAGGLAKQGMVPVVALYSTFLQRGYDQILQDIALLQLHVVLAIDRAGLVGSDGETHQGIFDISFLSTIPNMHLMAPKNKWELSDMLKFAVDFEHPIALRYPRGEAYDEYKEFRAPIVFGKSEMIYEEEDIALLAVGSMFKTAIQVRRKLKEIGYNCTLVNARFMKPFDTECLQELAKDHRLVVTLEENVKKGGFGEQIESYATENGLPYKVLIGAIPDEYVEHGNVDILKQETGIDAESIVKKIITVYTGM